MYTLRPELPADAAEIETLHAHLMGPGRYTRTAYRIRERASDAAALAFVAECPGGLCGSIRFSHVWLGEVAGLLLGPLAVSTGMQGVGIGLALMLRGLTEARTIGETRVVLVGDLPYYARAGFTPVPGGRLTMPGPVDPDRLLWRELVPGAFEGVSGLIRPRSIMAAASAALGAPGEEARGEDEGEAEQRRRQRH